MSKRADILVLLEKKFHDRLCGHGTDKSIIIGHSGYHNIVSYITIPFTMLSDDNFENYYIII